MSRRHKLLFVALSLFPFLLALSFRAVDNYQFAMERERNQKLNPDYFPRPSGLDEMQQEHQQTCLELSLMDDSIEFSAEESELPLD